MFLGDNSFNQYLPTGTSSVTWVHVLFGDIVLSQLADWDVSSVKDIGDMFREAKLF
jgi:hypothetical protein